MLKSFLATIGAIATVLSAATALPAAHAAPLDSSSNPVSFRLFQPSQDGGCNNTTKSSCVAFSDGYRFVIEDQIHGFQTSMDGSREQFTGDRAMYAHDLHSLDMIITVNPPIKAGLMLSTFQPSYDGECQGNPYARCISFNDGYTLAVDDLVTSWDGGTDSTTQIAHGRRASYVHRAGSNNLTIVLGS